MTEPRNDYERRAEASERAEGQGRSVLAQPLFTWRRVLLALALIALSVALQQIVDAMDGPTWVRAIVSGACIGAAVVVLTGGRGERRR